MAWHCICPVSLVPQWSVCQPALHGSICKYQGIPAIYACLSDALYCSQETLSLMLLSECTRPGSWLWTGL